MTVDTVGRRVRGCAPRRRRRVRADVLQLIRHHTRAPGRTRRRVRRRRPDRRRELRSGRSPPSRSPSSPAQPPSSSPPSSRSAAAIAEHNPAELRALRAPALNPIPASVSKSSFATLHSTFSPALNRPCTGRRLSHDHRRTPPARPFRRRPARPRPHRAGACREIIEAIGEDPAREGLLDTPARVARMYAELFEGLRIDPTEYLKVGFEAGHDEMVILRDIPFYSVCEHHFMPFHGTAAVGYIPDGRVVGVSKLARVVEGYARRPQLQERLTSQVADALMDTMEPDGVAVVIEAEHLCMTQRGIKKPGMPHGHVGDARHLPQERRHARASFSRWCADRDRNREGPRWRSTRSHSSRSRPSGRACSPVATSRCRSSRPPGSASGSSTSRATATLRLHDRPRRRAPARPSCRSLYEEGHAEFVGHYSICDYLDGVVPARLRKRGHRMRARRARAQTA